MAWHIPPWLDQLSPLSKHPPLVLIHFFTGAFLGSSLRCFVCGHVFFCVFIFWAKKKGNRDNLGIGGSNFFWYFCACIPKFPKSQRCNFFRFSFLSFYRCFYIDCFALDRKIDPEKSNPRKFLQYWKFLSQSAEGKGWPPWWSCINPKGWIPLAYPIV